MYMKKLVLFALAAALTVSTSRAQNGYEKSVDIGFLANIRANLIDANQYLRDAPGFMLQPNFGIDFRLSEKKALSPQ